METRPIPLLLEIRQHFQVWKQDPYFKEIPKIVKDTMRLFIDSMDAGEGIERAKEVSISTSKELKKKESQKFLAIYKKKYLELTDREMSETINDVKYVIIKTAIVKLVTEESDSAEYLNWFFEMLKEPQNVKMCPPNIGLAISDAMISKFLYDRKDELKVRKLDMMESDKKVILIKLASTSFDLSDEKEVAELIVKFGANAISMTKFKDFLCRKASELNKTDLVEKLESLNTDWKKIKKELTLLEEKDKAHA